MAKNNDRELTVTMPLHRYQELKKLEDLKPVDKEWLERSLAMLQQSASNINNFRNTQLIIESMQDEIKKHED